MFKLQHGLDSCYLKYWCDSGKIFFNLTCADWEGSYCVHVLTVCPFLTFWLWHQWDSFLWVSDLYRNNLLSICSMYRRRAPVIIVHLLCIGSWRFRKTETLNMNQTVCILFCNFFSHYFKVVSSLLSIGSACYSEQTKMILSLCVSILCLLIVK